MHYFVQLKVLLELPELLVLVISVRVTGERASKRVTGYTAVTDSLTFSSTFPHAFGVDDIAHIFALPVAGFLYIGWQHNVAPHGGISVE